MKITGRSAKEILADFSISTRTVYENTVGETRLVVSVSNGVVIWRTADANLAHGEKAQGSATVSSFKRWATSHRLATHQDYDAYDQVMQRRELRDEVTIARRMIRGQKRI